jgi:hypothetical protein
VNKVPACPANRDAALEGHLCNDIFRRTVLIVPVEQPLDGSGEAPSIAQSVTARCPLSGCAMGSEYLKSYYSLKLAWNVTGRPGENALVAALAACCVSISV